MSTTAPPSTYLTKHSRIELEIWSAAFVHNNCYANYNQMRSPKDWRQHVDQLKARAKTLARRFDQMRFTSPLHSDRN